MKFYKILNICIFFSIILSAFICGVLFCFHEFINGFGYEESYIASSLFIILNFALMCYAIYFFTKHYITFKKINTPFLVSMIIPFAYIIGIIIPMCLTDGNGNLRNLIITSSLNLASVACYLVFTLPYLFKDFNLYFPIKNND